MIKALKRIWRAWGREFLRQLYFELVKMFGRKRTHVGFGAFVLLEVLFVFFFKQQKIVDVIQRDVGRAIPGPLKLVIDPAYYLSALTLGHMILAGAVVLLGGIFLALVAGDIVSKEEEDGTLRMVLSRPITRGRLLAVKFCACGAFTFVLVAFAALSSLLTGMSFWPTSGGFFVSSGDMGFKEIHGYSPGLWRFLFSIPFLALSMFTVTSIAFLFSCMRMKPATATILTLALLFIDLIFKMMPPMRDYRELFVTAKMSSWQLLLQKEIDWALLLKNFGFLGLISIAAFLVGWSIFSRRDFKS